MHYIPNANGVKTGYTGNAGKCLVSSVNNDNNDVVIVVLNCYQRWNETKKIYDYIKKNYSYKRIIDKDTILAEVNSKRLEKNIKLVTPIDIIIPISF